MDKRQFEYFVAVAEELSFTHAAARLRAAQSTVSASIRALERELGAELFERAGGRVSLSSVGEAVLPEVRTALEAIGRVRSSANPSAALRGRVRVGVYTSQGQINPAGMVGEFIRENPLVDIQLAHAAGGPLAMLEDLRRNRLDITFAALPDPPPDLASEVLLVSPYCAVLPASSPLATAGSVSLAELAGPWIDVHAGYGTRKMLDQAFADLGLSRRITAEVTDLQQVVQLVEAMPGNAAMPEFLFTPTPEVVSVPLVEQIDWTLRLVTRPNPSRPTAAVRDLVARHYAEYPHASAAAS